MVALVLSLDAVRRTDVARAGGKAAALGTLLAEGFPVPPALCLTADAFTLALAPYRLRIAVIMGGRDLRDPAQAMQAADAISSMLAELTMPEAVLVALRAALPLVADADAAVAVRSSATDEDGAAVSFAGQYETVLGARGEASITAAVLTCWRSFFRANALTARAAAGPAGEGRSEGAMAVLIQRMVDAECAGVCFTLDPVRPQRGLIVVDAAWGLGAGTVDGSVATDTAWLIRAEPWRIEDRRIVEKPERIALDPAGGVRREAVPDERQRAACLPEPWLQRITEFGVACEVLLGRPQDVEWAIAGGQVWILQSRPITTLPPEHAGSWQFPVAWADQTDRARSWRLDGTDREQLPPPLESDVSAAFSGAMADANPLSAWDGFPRQHLINGRRYIRWVPSELGPGDVRVRKKALSDLVIRLRAEGKSMWDHWAPEIKAAIARLHAFDAAGADGKMLAEHLEDAFGVFRRHWMIHWCSWTDDKEARPELVAFSAMTGLEGRAAEEGLAPLTEGEETIFTRLVDGLNELAQTARALPALAALVTERPADAWQRIKQLPEAGAFRRQVAAFLERFGDHMGMGYGSSSTIRRQTWRQDPAQVLAMIAPYLQPGRESTTAARVRTRAEREARLEQLCAACDDPEKVAAFRRLLPVARKEATFLEEHNYWIDQVAYGQLRTAIAAAGRRLLDGGVIAGEDDIFWLHMEEITAALHAETAAPQTGLIAERKAEAEARRAQKPPPLLGLPRAQLESRPPLTDEISDGNPEGAARLSGAGAGAGRRRGRARVVPWTTAIPPVEPGDILVALNAGPAWTPIFPVLGGLVLEEGAFGQHGATTAREYGVPAVIRVRGATRRIPDGGWVTIDGEAGTVEIEQDDGVSGEQVSAGVVDVPAQA